MTIGVPLEYIEHGNHLRNGTLNAVNVDLHAGVLKKVHRTFGVVSITKTYPSSQR
jgi:hypothetical protein